ncbi:MAG: IMP cyclohydrolase [Clostridia bacterium]|nr:IMP cyclohydrolase [Clostridia bacterium]
MSYQTLSMKERIEGNPYVGRGIVIGKSEDGKKAVFVYFIMGRSENSRNRVFKVEGDKIVIYPFDESKVEDPSLIIYSPVKVVGKDVVVTNGDQTDTIETYLKAGKCFTCALKTRAFEPDAPNFTPRISGILHFKDGFTYEMSILKSADEKGSACNRYTFDYEPLSGVGHFIHTYVTDGNPLPTFFGEPERVKIPNCLKSFAEEIWENLDKNNKIALCARSIDLVSGESEQIVYNIHEVK